MEMLMHFQVQSLFLDKRVPGWTFSFYYKQNRYQGVYHRNGEIEWKSFKPEKNALDALTKQIHDLMLYHVYDHER